MPRNWPNRLLGPLANRQSNSRNRKKQHRRRVLVESLEDRRLLAVVAYNELSDGDLDDSTATPTFLLDTAGTNTWQGSLTTPTDALDGFRVDLAYGLSVTDIRASYTDNDAGTDPDAGMRVSGDILDHSFSGTESVTAGSFSTVNPVLPITNSTLVSQLLSSILFEAATAVPAGDWTLEIDTVVSPLAPLITTSNAATVDENQTLAIDIDSVDDSDSEGSGLTYSISGGVDASLFTINASTGVVQFNTAPNFELPSDDDTDNVYELDIEVTDSDLMTSSQSLQITVSDINEAPVADAGGPYSIDAGLVLMVDASGTTDPDAGDTLTYDWDLDGDGTADYSTTNAIATIPWLTVIDHIGVGSHSIDLTVTDALGLSSTDSAALDISDLFFYPSDTAVDEYTLEIAGADLQVNTTIGGTLLSRVPIATIVNIAVIGSSDAETLTVDYTGGFINVPISFDGNDPISGSGDTLQLLGASPQSVTHTFVDESTGSVSIVMDVSTSGTIQYTGLEPIVDNLSATDRVFTFTGGAETITLSDDPVAADNVNRIDSTLGELVDFLNPTNSLTINAGTGADTVDLAALDSSTAFPTLTVNGDDDADVINVPVVASGLTVNLNGGVGNDTFNVGTTTIDAIEGAVVIAGDANDATPTVTEGVTAKTNTIDVTLEVGDSLNIAESGQVADHTYTLTDTTFARAGLSGTISYGTIETLVIDTGSGIDDITVTSTAASASTTINTDGGNDIVAVTTTGASSILSINSVAGDDAVSITNTGDGSVTLVSTDIGEDDVVVTSTGAASGLSISTSDDIDVVDLLGTGAGSATLISLGIGNDVANVQSTGSGSATDIYGGTGEDTFNLSSDADGDRGNASGDPAGTLAGFLGDICVYGEAPIASPGVPESITAKTVTVTVSIDRGDELNVSDEGNLVGQTFTLDDTTLVSSGLPGSLTYDTIETLNIESGSGGDTIGITTTLAGTRTTFSSFAGADSVAITTTGADSLLDVDTGDGIDGVTIATTGASSLTRVDTGIGNDDVTVSTTGTGSGLSVDTGPDIDVLSLLGTGGSSAVSAALGNGSDVANIQATGVGSATDVMGGNGNDTFNVTSTADGDRSNASGDPDGNLDGLLGDICVYGGAHVAGTDTVSVDGRMTIGDTETISTTVETGDSLNVSDESSVAAHAYSVDATSLERTGVGNIAYETVETLTLEAGQGASTVAIASTADATSFHLDTFAGADTVAITTTGADSITQIVTGDDADVVTIDSTGTESVTTVDTGAAADTVSISSLGDQAGVQVDAAAGNDVINLLVEPAAPARTGSAVIDVNAGDGEDVFNVDEVYLNTVVDLSGDADNDLFTLSSPGADADGYLENLNHDPLGDDLVAATRQLFLDGGANDAGTSTVVEGVTVVADSPVEGSVGGVAVGDRVVVDASASTNPLDLRFVMTDHTQGVLATTTPVAPGDPRATTGNEVFETLGLESVDIVTGSADDILTLSSDIPIGIGSTAQLVTYDGGAGTDKIEVVGGDDADLITIGDDGGATLEPIEIGNVELVRVDGGGGDDQISTQTETLGSLNGGAGSDTIFGGTAEDLITGGPGVDFLFGGDGNDVLVTDQDFGSPALFIEDGEIIHGGDEDNLLPGDVCIQYAVDDIFNCEVLGDGGGTKDVITWLQAILIPLAPIEFDGTDEFLPPFEPVLPLPIALDAVTEPSQVPLVIPPPVVTMTRPSFDPADVNLDGVVSARDALVIINHIARTQAGNASGEGVLSEQDALKDVNGNGTIEPRDALMVINQIARSAAALGEGEGLADAAGWGPAVDSVLGGLADSDDEEERFLDDLLLGLG